MARARKVKELPEKKGYGLHFGAMSKTLSFQLKEQGIKFDADEIEHFQKDVYAINRLRIRSLITPLDSSSAIARLMKKVTKHLDTLN